MSIETAIYGALAAAIAAAEDGDPLFEAELHDTLYARVSKLHGVRVGDVDAELAPSPGGDVVEEFNATLILQCFARVQGETAAARAAARDKATTIAHDVAKIFFDDPTLEGNVRDAIVAGLTRGWATVQSTPYAVAVVHLAVNETGQMVE